MEPPPLVFYVLDMETSLKYFNMFITKKKLATTDQLEPRPCFLEGLAL